ncbi:MAG: dTMP kinase [Candidatus Lindowbacteria bacterium RIFCSPLOWO2_12_FULL_62_27]|nr:MAG: dTMP kinase [Candidatus Lindowbacteria bacterium RIFCSPLOWO2_12_FULL_62_27]OGH61635.1 MAG: dTMP kinase [Candidatus Lindowbacteria bacterium RIFCSPLOWO2_02_FULL_62_12]
MRGFFLTLEGPEGSGKSTQAVKIVAYLRRLGRRVVHTREPGGTPLGESIRKLLLDPAYHSVCPETEFLLYEAVRAQHTREKILRHLRGGGVVVCERYSDASLAYQGFGRGLNLRTLMAVDRFATAGLKPSLTLLFDLPVETGLRKAVAAKKEFAARGDRIERAGLAFHRRVRRGYLTLAKRSKRLRVIPIVPASTPESTFGIVRKILDGYLNKSAADARHAKR